MNTNPDATFASGYRVRTTPLRLGLRSGPLDFRQRQTPIVALRPGPLPQKTRLRVLAEVRTRLLLLQDVSERTPGYRIRTTPVRLSARTAPVLLTQRSVPLAPQLRAIVATRTRLRIDPS